MTSDTLPTLYKPSSIALQALKQREFIGIHHCRRTRRPMMMHQSLSKVVQVMSLLAVLTMPSLLAVLRQSLTPEHDTSSQTASCTSKPPSSLEVLFIERLLKDPEGVAALGLKCI